MQIVSQVGHVQGQTSDPGRTSMCQACSPRGALAPVPGTAPLYRLQVLRRRGCTKVHGGSLTARFPGPARLIPWMVSFPRHQQPAPPSLAHQEPFCLLPPPQSTHILRLNSVSGFAFFSTALSQCCPNPAWQSPNANGQQFRSAASCPGSSQRLASRVLQK